MHGCAPLVGNMHFLAVEDGAVGIPGIQHVADGKPDLPDGVLLQCDVMGGEHLFVFLAHQAHLIGTELGFELNAIFAFEGYHHSVEFVPGDTIRHTQLWIRRR
jgi:hypothetical protein